MHLALAKNSLLVCGVPLGYAVLLLCVCVYAAARSLAWGNAIPCEHHQQCETGDVVSMTILTSLLLDCDAKDSGLTEFAL